MLDSQDRLGVDRWARYTFCRGNTLHVAAVAACRHQWRRRWGRRGGAAVGEEVAEVVVRFCARAAMRSAETSWWQCRRGAVAAASRRFSPERIGSRLGFRWGKLGGGEPHISIHQSPPHLYRAARREPTSLILGIRARVKGPVGRWANGWRSIPTFSPLISSYIFTFYIFYFFSYFITG